MPISYSVDHCGPMCASVEDVARLLTVVERAIDQVCTVGRTLKSGTKVTLEVSGAGVS